MFQEEKDIFERYAATSPRTDDLKVWGKWFTEFAGQSDALLMRRRAAAADAEAGVLDEFGEAISCLELLLALGIGMGQTMLDEVPMPAPDETPDGEIININDFDQWRLVVIYQLWLRAAGVCEQILSLLKAGFSAAALARWRTIHELEVICLVLGKSTKPQIIYDKLKYEGRDATKFLGDKQVLNKEFPRRSMLAGEYGWADQFVAEMDPNGYGGGTELQRERRRRYGPSFADLRRSVGVSAREEELYKAANGVIHGGRLSEVLGSRVSLALEAEEALGVGMTLTMRGTARTIWAITGILSELAERAGATYREEEHARLEVLIHLLDRTLGVTAGWDEGLLR